MKFIVKAVSININTGEVEAGPRDEEIDTEENVLFSGCFSEWDVEDQYEAFWNRLNDHWEDDFPRNDKVKVLSVRKAEA